MNGRRSRVRTWLPRRRATPCPMNSIPIAKLPFEEALQALESIIAQIEQGQIGLEASMAAYQRGDQLVRRCKAVLDDAEQREDLRIEEIPSDDAS